MEKTLIISIMWKLLCNIFHNVEIKRWIKSYDSFTHGLQINLLFSWSSMHWCDKNAQFVMPKVLTITHSLFCKNVGNRVIFAEGFWPVFYARGRFMKYSMFVLAWYCSDGVMLQTHVVISKPSGPWCTLRPTIQLNK